MTTSSDIAIESKFVAEPVESTQGRSYNRGRRLAHSAWLITVNTNKEFHGTEDNFQEEYDRIKGVIDQVFGNESLSKNASKYFPIRRSGAYNAKTADHQYNNSYIKNIKVEITSELGGERSLLHFHIVVWISHWTYLNIAIPTIRTDLQQLYGQSLYINMKRLHTSSVTKAREYIRKTLHKSNA